MSKDKKDHDGKKVTIGVDLDGTLARYEGWVHHTDIGSPIPMMVSRVKKWLENGYSVWVFTARMNADDPAIHPEIENSIRDWCKKHIGQELPVTGKKLLSFTVMYDDRARHVTPNIGTTSIEEIIRRFSNEHIEEEWLTQALETLNELQDEIHGTHF